MSDNPYLKVPPHNAEMERAVLGAIMLEQDKRQEVMELISSEEVFYLNQHQTIYKAILELQQKGQDVDLLTVNAWMNRNKITDLGDDMAAFYLTKMTMDVVSSAHVIGHTITILQLWKYREVIKACGNMTVKAYEADITTQEQAIADFQAALTRIDETGVVSNAVHISQPLRENLDRLEMLRNRTQGLIGIDTGLHELNKLTNGWQSPDLVILAARPSQGKTALALNYALAAAQGAKSDPVGVYIQSLEMSAAQLTNRLLSTISDVDMERINNGELSDAQMLSINAAASRLHKLNIHIDDKAAVTVKQLHGKVRRLKKKKDIGLIIVDYLQLLTVSSLKGKSRENVVAEISRDLKIMAKELKVPVIALSQMNRSIDGQKDRKPNLSDLRESGAIEQDADIVIFIYHSTDANSNQPKAELVVAKHRNGKTGDIEVKFFGANQRWTDADNSQFQDFTPFNPYAGFQNANTNRYREEEF